MSQPSMEEKHRLVAKVSKAKLSALKPGVTIKALNKKSIIFYKNSDNDEASESSWQLRIRACRNICYHQGGSFVPVEDCIVQCTKHNWRLDVRTMKYVNPPMFNQEELVVHDDGGDDIALYEIIPPLQPWEVDPRPRALLEPNEVTVTYYSHACVEMNFNGITMFTDPWLIGPSFARGWWLLHEPPPNWLEHLCNANLIYVSHLHSDHLNYPTMKLIAQRNPDVPIFVGDLAMPVFSRQRQYGVEMRNVTALTFGEWHVVNDDLRFMILPDGVHSEMDTCLLVDYKGHIIFNTIDCSKPNYGHLPRNIDILMGDFAGGASPYPICFNGGRYTDQFKLDFVRTERKKLLNDRVAIVKKTKPRLYIPIAGYFVEAHPSDGYVRDFNKKNDSSVLVGIVEKYDDSVKTWAPKPGESVDLATLKIAVAPLGSKVTADEWNFDKYIKWVDRCIDFAPFQYDDSTNFYFDWVGFRDYNLVVKLVETGDDYETIPGGRTFFIDFIDLSYPKERPCRDHNFLEIRARIGVFRQIMKFGCLWNSLTVGFQSRLSREPDIYHIKFWTHVQSLLPETPPDWKAFLENKGWSKEKIEWAMSEPQTPQFMIP